MTSVETAQAIKEFDAELAKLSIEGYWNTIGVLAPEPKPRANAFLWRWKDVYGNLFKATQIVNLEDGAERRSLRLCTPGLPWRSTTETIQASIQMILPGEVARAHRHSAAAFRFIIEGSGGYTTVDGERYLMEPGDLVLTPHGTWHDHGNLSKQPIVWLDVLDFPFVRMLNGLFFEAYNDRSQNVTRSDGYGQRKAGPARPAGLQSPRTGVPFHYSGVQSLSLLQELPVDDADPFDGVTIEFVNPINGGPTMPTNQCRMHRLAPSLRLRRHRHTWNTVFHVVSGTGRTVAGDQTLTWGPHDTFSVPSWLWHQHQPLDGEAVLFSVTDEPIFKAFALDRMEEAAS
jgi:gentisate 1,2-dioxygenase